jgi:hypothetical protein
VLPPNVTFRSAMPMGVVVPVTVTTKPDGFIDDLIQVFLDIPKIVSQAPQTVPLAIHLTSRPYAGSAEPVQRRNLLSDLKASCPSSNYPPVLHLPLQNPKKLLTLTRAGNQPALKAPLPQDKQQRGGAANKPDMNKAIQDEWQLPTGKLYRDFFHPICFKENTQAWPNLTHHDHSKGNKEMCMQ